MRDVSLSSLLAKVREIRLGKLTRLERDNIGRRVRRQYLFVEAIQECEENNLNEDIDLEPDDLPFDKWIAQTNEDVPLEPQEEDFEQEDLVNAPVDAEPIHGQADDATVDVWRSGDTVRPLTEEEVPVLARLREVYRTKRKESAPSLKSRDQKKVAAKIFLINGLVGNIAKSCNSISDVNQLLYACSYLVAEEIKLCINEITVIGPMPPGTGGTASRRSLSATRPSSRRAWNASSGNPSGGTRRGGALPLLG